jgi:transposase
MSAVFAGLDWASQAHAVCVIDDRGTVREQWELAHDAAGLAALVRHLRRHGVGRIALERPSGLLVDVLVEAGFQVVPIHPNAVKASRPRYRSHGGKSDASDAYLLADLLRTDGHRFHPLAPQSDSIRALRARVRGRDDLVATRVQLANQLRELLQTYWTGAAEIFADVDSPIALAFIQRYPTPEAAHRLGPKRLAAFCAQHAYCGRRSADDLLARLRQAARVSLGELESDAKGELACCLARTLDRLVEQIRLLSSRIEHHVADSDDGRILMSFPRAGRICAAQILAELGSVRARFDSDEHLAAEAGVAPVTYASGKHKAVAFRWACNHRLRAAITCLADNSRHASAWAAGVYAKTRGRGCDHPHAVRILARAWLRVIWRAWIDGEPYDPQRHGGAQLVAQTTGG